MIIYKICAPDYFNINTYKSTVTIDAVAIAHNDNNNININIGPTHLKIDHGNQPTYYYDSHDDNNIDNNNALF